MREHCHFVECIVVSQRIYLCLPLNGLMDKLTFQSATNDPTRYSVFQVRITAQNGLFSVVSLRFKRRGDFSWSSECRNGEVSVIVICLVEEIIEVHRINNCHRLRRRNSEIELRGF